MTTKKICRTVYKEDILDAEDASSLYRYLKYNTQWEDGIRSKKGFTRKAKMMVIGDDPQLDTVIIDTLRKIAKYDYLILGIYLNYYANGKMWTPNHSHPGTHQLVISLGSTRVLDVGKKQYPMQNGSAIIFGGSSHGIQKDPQCKRGRISIATFMLPC